MLHRCNAMTWYMEYDVVSYKQVCGAVVMSWVAGVTLAMYLRSWVQTFNLKKVFFFSRWPPDIRHEPSTIHPPILLTKLHSHCFQPIFFHPSNPTTSWTCNAPLTLWFIFYWLFQHVFHQVQKPGMFVMFYTFPHCLPCLTSTIG